MATEPSALATAATELPAATPETVATQEGVTASLPDEPKQAERTFTQQELNEIVQKEKAKAERRAERNSLKAYRETLERVMPQQQSAQSDGKPTRAQFNGDDEAYVEAIADWKVTQRDRQAQQQRQLESQRETAGRTEKLYAEASKLPGFDRETFDELPLTPVIAQTVIDSDVSAQLMAWMSSNPEDVERISKLSPARQAAEIGRLEAKLTVVKETKTAPPPLAKTVNTSGSVNMGKLMDADYDKFVKMRKQQIASRR